VVRNHEGGTRSVSAGTVPKDEPARVKSGSGLHQRERRRDDLRQPQERQLDAKAASGKRWTSVGKDGVKGQEGARIHGLRREYGPGRWPSKSPRAPRERNAVKDAEGGRERNARRHPRVLSPQWVSRSPGRAQQSARTPRKRAEIGSNDSPLGSPSRQSGPRWCGRRNEGRNASV